MTDKVPTDAEVIDALCDIIIELSTMMVTHVDPRRVQALIDRVEAMRTQE
jgi:hypothetical protein